MELVPKSAPLETSTEPLLPTSPAEEGTTGCLQTLYVEFPEDEKPPADHEVSPSKPSKHGIKYLCAKYLKLPVSKQLQGPEYSVVICSILLCFPIGLSSLWFLYKANKLEETDMKKSYEVFLIGRLLGRIGFVLGILLATILIAILFIYEVIPR